MWANLSNFLKIPCFLCFSNSFIFLYCLYVSAPSLKTRAMWWSAIPFHTPAALPHRQCFCSLFSTVTLILDSHTLWGSNVSLPHFLTHPLHSPSQWYVPLLRRTRAKAAAGCWLRIASRMQSQEKMRKHCLCWSSLRECNFAFSLHRLSFVWLIVCDPSPFFAFNYFFFCWQVVCCHSSFELWFPNRDLQPSVYHSPYFWFLFLFLVFVFTLIRMSACACGLEWRGKVFMKVAKRMKEIKKKSFINENNPMFWTYENFKSCNERKEQQMLQKDLWWLFCHYKEERKLQWKPLGAHKAMQALRQHVNRVIVLLQMPQLLDGVTWRFTFLYLNIFVACILSSEK